MAQRFDVKAFSNAWNTHQPDRILEFYSDDAEIIVPPDTDAYRGKQGVRENIQEVMKGMEDINGDVQWSTQEGDKVAMLVEVTGKHTGPLPVSSQHVIPPTHKKVRFMVGIFLTLDGNGKIKREIDLADNLGMLAQVDAMPQMGKQGQEQQRATR